MTAAARDASKPGGTRTADALLAGAGFAVLYVLPYAAGFLSGSGAAAYHSLQPMTTVYRAMLWVLAGGWLLGALAFGLEPCPGVPARRITGLAAVVLLVLLAGRAAASGAASAWGLDWPLRAASGVALAALAVGLALLRLRPALLDRAAHVSRLLFRVAAFGMLVLVPCLALPAFSRRAQESRCFERAGLAPSAPGAPRIVWLLLDELSYDQLFDHRASSLALPNFDALARSSVVFSHVEPIGDRTQSVIPAMLIGRRLEGLRSDGRGRLLVRTPDGGRRPFDERQTIFAEAQSAGWTTGVAGWYNPYCRLMPDVLDRCFWQFSEPVSGNLDRYLSSSRSTSRNVLAMMPGRGPLARSLGISLEGGMPPHRRDYLAVMEQARRLLDDTRIRFLLIHLNIPHPVNLYDRAQGRLRDGGSYLDNLALADRSLGELRAEIASTPSAGETALVVCSDHSWRTFLWRGSSAWTREDEAASGGGRFDPRPVLIVHLAGADAASRPAAAGRTGGGRDAMPPGGAPVPAGGVAARDGIVVSTPVSLLAVHPLLEALLHGEIHSNADVAAVARRAPRTTPPAASSGMAWTAGAPPGAGAGLVAASSARPTRSAPGQQPFAPGRAGQATHRPLHRAPLPGTGSGG